MMIYDSKKLGRKLLAKDYGCILLAVLVVTLLAGSGFNLIHAYNAYTYGLGYSEILTFDLTYEFDVPIPILIPYFGILSYIVMSIALIRFFLQPLTNGLCIMFIDMHHDTKGGIHSVFQDTFSSSYWRYLGGYLWERFFILLWSMLLWIPGIIKHYAYSMNRYILAEYKSVSITRALDISKRMTKGYKMELFFFDLSYFGWMVLSILTLGLLNFLYVRPYYLASKAALYLKIKENALENKRISYYELKIPEPVKTASTYQSIAIANQSGTLK